MKGTARPLFCSPRAVCAFYTCTSDAQEIFLDCAPPSFSGLRAMGNTQSHGDLIWRASHFADAGSLVDVPSCWMDMPAGTASAAANALPYKPPVSVRPAVGAGLLHTRLLTEDDMRALCGYTEVAHPHCAYDARDEDSHLPTPGGDATPMRIEADSLAESLALAHGIQHGLATKGAYSLHECKLDYRDPQDAIQRTESYQGYTEVAHPHRAYDARDKDSHVPAPLDEDDDYVVMEDDIASGALTEAKILKRLIYNCLIL
jgi:hypothetical protein